MKEGWEYRKLGEFIEEFSVRDKGKGYPVYSVTNTKGFCQEFFGKKVASENTSNYKVVPRGCFAYNPSRINVGSVAWQNQEENVSVSPLYVVFSVSPKLRKDYLLYYIKSNYSMTFINALSRGAVRNNLRLSTLKTFKVPYASISEQQHVVEELDLLSFIIEKKKAQLNELNNLAQSLFFEMFGDPITNDKGWKVKKVIDVVKLQRGFDLPVQERNQAGKIPIYGANGIVGYHNESKAEFGIITGRSGSIGEVFMSSKPFWPLNTSLFSVDTHGNNVVYLMFLIRNYDLLRFKEGAGVPTLNRNSFHQNDIIDTPLTLQQEFASKIEAIEHQKELIRQSIKEVETLFNSRMDYYFN